LENPNLVDMVDECLAPSYAWNIPPTTAESFLYTPSREAAHVITTTVQLLVIVLHIVLLPWYVYINEVQILRMQLETDLW
jgi:hypothetical protein